MLKLFYLPGSCSLVSHIALEWSGLDYSAEEVQHDTIKNTEYLALNPQGQVPLLVDEKWVLAENFAIIDYINDLVPEKAIFGTKAYSLRSILQISVQRNIYVMLRWTEICKIDLSEYANLQPFYHRVEADQRVKTALKSEGLA